MRREDVLICYDIRNKKELNALIDKVLKIFDEKVDDLRVYTIKNRGIALGKAIDLNNHLILI